MRRRIGMTTTIAAAAAAALWLMSADATMQQRAGAGQNAPTPRTSDGKVDLSGVWIAGGGGGGGGDLKPDEQGNVTVLSRGRPCHPGQ